MSEVNIFVSLEVFSVGFPTVIAAVQLNLYPFELTCFTHIQSNTQQVFILQTSESGIR